MTTTDLTNLIRTANLSDATDRAMLADALEDAGRILESQILRAELPARATQGEVCPELYPGGVATQDEWPAWINCHWGPHSIGGCWIHDESSAYKENQRCGYHASHPHCWEAGDCEAYEGSDMTGGSLPDADYFAELGLSLEDDDAEILEEWLQKESLRVCQPIVDQERAKMALRAVREAFVAFEGAWDGCDWTTDFGDYSLDLHGMDADTAREIAEILERESNGECVLEDDIAAVVEAAAASNRRQQLITGSWNLQRDELEKLANTWREASDWLSDCQQRAMEAEGYARAAVAAAHSGDWDEAKSQALAACALERIYGDAPVWSPLLRAIEAAAELS